MSTIPPAKATGIRFISGRRLLLPVLRGDLREKVKDGERSAVDEHVQFSKLTEGKTKRVVS